jgi:hypothetical protein
MLHGRLYPAIAATLLALSAPSLAGAAAAALGQWRALLKPGSTDAVGGSVRF